MWPVSKFCEECGEDWSKGPHFHLPADFKHDPELERHIADLLRRADEYKEGLSYPPLVLDVPRVDEYGSRLLWWLFHRRRENKHKEDTSQ